MVLALAVFAAGGAGALTRFATDRAVTRRWQGAFPMGTFFVNVTGSLLLGLITGYTGAKVNISHQNVQAILGTGFVGAYTTFSTEEWQTVALYRAGGGLEVLNILGGFAASLALGALGLWIGGRV